MIRALLIPALPLSIFAVVLGTSQYPERNGVERSSPTEQGLSAEVHENLGVTSIVDCTILSAGGQAVPDGPSGVVGQLTVGLVLNGPTGANHGAVPCWIRQVGGYFLTRYVFGGGAASGQSGPFLLRATAGESVAGTVSNGGFVLTAGYWPPLSKLGDCDGNGTSTLDDYHGLAACLAGPSGTTVSPECACYDLHVDRHSDLRDFRSFQNGFAGPG